MKKATLFLDRATYHENLDDNDRKPTTAWKKTRISNAINRWGRLDYGWIEGWEYQKQYEY